MDKNRPESVFSQATTIQPGESADAKPAEFPPEYVYYVKKEAKLSQTPSENQQRPEGSKKRSRLSSFLSRMQSPAVQRTKAIAEAKEDEERRTGVKTYRPVPVPGTAWAF